MVNALAHLLDPIFLECRDLEDVKNGAQDLGVRQQAGSRKRPITQPLTAVREVWWWPKSGKKPLLCLVSTDPSIQAICD